VGTDVEGRFHDGRVLIGSDQIRRGPLPEQKPDGPDEDRLSCPGLARDDVQTVMKGQVSLSMMAKL